MIMFHTRSLQFTVALMNCNHLFPVPVSSKQLKTGNRNRLIELAGRNSK